MTVIKHDIHTYLPVIFSGPNADVEFSKFSKQWELDNETLSIVDDSTEEAKEYALLMNPSVLRSGEAPKKLHELDLSWIVFPWRKTAVRTLARREYDALRASRNFNLITKGEAMILGDKKVGIAGLNVGNPAAVCLALEGIGAYFRMADNDILSLSNLNRFRASITDLGVNKAVLSARQVLEINPFLSVDVWDKGIDLENISEFVSGIDILIEEMDALPLKIAIREEARRQRIPTIMVTGSGHDIILDIERFDREPKLKILSGTLTEDVQNGIALGPKNFDEKVALARDFMGTQYLSERLVSSFDEVGKSLIGIPQLAEASFIRGAALTHACRDILLGENIQSGRYAFGLSQLYEIKRV